MVSQRARTPAQRGLDALFRPRSVAVIGASRRPGAIGRQVVSNLVAAGFTGPVYPINPQTGVVLSMPTHTSVKAISGPVDLAVLCVPADQVLVAAQQCGRKGVRGLVVVSAGFREIGGAGVGREAKLKAIAARYGMRVIGPNCMGVINTDPEYALNASFSATLPGPGRVAFVSQSGALGEAILADAAASGLGVAMFASVGNLVDVEPAELLEYWEHDPAVAVILLYLESFGDPARFVAAARRVSRVKPILAVKSGRSAAGAAAAGSHTGQVAGADALADTLLAQCGVLRVSSFREMFALAAALLHQPLPRGGAVAIVTNAGGPGILATDAVVGSGLEIAELGRRTTAALRRALPVEASVRNPVDLIASADAARYRAALRAVAADPAVDLLLVLFVSPIMIDAVAVAEAIVGEVERAGKPAVACLMGRQRGDEALRLLKDHGIVVFRYPEDAALTAAGLVRRARLLHRRSRPAPRVKVDRAAAAKYLTAGRGWLAADQAEDVLRAYGVRFAASRWVRSAGDAVTAAHELGFPVVVKAQANALLHRSELRAVKTRLGDSDAVYTAATELRRRLGPRFADLRLQVQAQAKGHREVLVGMTRDPRYGALFALGLGGVQVEVLRDVAVRLGPLDRDAPAEMLASLRGALLLGPFRGEPAAAVAAAVDTLFRLQQLVFDFPQIAEVEINPLILGVDARSSVAVDARLRVEE